MTETNEGKEKGKITEARLEIVVAVFLAITALLTAWASWIGSLHGGNQATNYSKSNNMAAEGNSKYNEGAQNLMQDMALWGEITDLQLEFDYAESVDDEDTINIVGYKLFYKCSDNLTENMADALGWDFDKAAASNDDPVKYVRSWLKNDNAKTSPFSDEAFVNSYYADALASLDESEALLKTGQQDNMNGDSFNLVTVFYSVVLFLLGIAGTFKRLPNRKLVVLVAIIGFILSTIYMFTLPMPTGFSFMSFFKH